MTGGRCATGTGNRERFGALRWLVPDCWAAALRRAHRCSGIVAVERMKWLAFLYGWTMVAVLVHGVPDTAELWDGVVEHLHRDDVMALRLPGFGSPRPEGFTATKEAYVDWLVETLTNIDEEIDLVGHDWGAMLTMRVASVVPGLMRSWVAGPGPVDDQYEWHAMAKQWQTPGAGEELMSGITPEVLAAGLAAERVPQHLADAAARRVDDTMKGCILDLYRSAVHVGREWAPDLPGANRDGLVVWGEHDPYAAVDVGARVAAAADVPLKILDAGHWWPAEVPETAASVLEHHWASVGS